MLLGEHADPSACRLVAIAAAAAAAVSVCLRDRYATVGAAAALCATLHMSADPVTAAALRRASLEHVSTAASDAPLHPAQDSAPDTMTSEAIVSHIKAPRFDVLLYHPSSGPAAPGRKRAL